MPSTLSVVCMGCAAEQTIGYPAEDSWEPVLSPRRGWDPVTVVGWQLTVKCSICGHRTVFNRGEG